MIEYLYDAIRAVAGEDIGVSAVITNELGTAITEDCRLLIHFDDVEMYAADGVYLPDEGLWVFTVPAEITAGRTGRYLYCIQHNNSNLCFKQPIYLV